MPWPHLPPNPDTMPAPFDGDIFAFSLQLEGMDPYKEQFDCRFYGEGVDAGVFVPIELDASAYKYTGVCLVPLTSVGSKVKYEGEYPAKSEWNSDFVTVDNSLLQGSVSSPTYSWDGSKVDIKVDYTITGTSTDLNLVAVPYMHVLPVYSSQAAYAAAYGAVSISGTSGTVTITVTPGPATTYAVFMAENLSTAIEPVSAALSLTI